MTTLWYNLIDCFSCDNDRFCDMDRAQLIVNNCIDCSAIVSDCLSALEPAITQDMGHDGWANDVTLSNIHERSLFTLRFHLYENSKVSMETP